MKIKYIILILLSPLAWANAETAASAPAAAPDTSHCAQTARLFIEGDALAQICRVQTDAIAENLQQTARNITDRLNQCSQNLNNEQKEKLFVQLEQEPQLATIKTVAQSPDDKVRQNWCQNATERLVQLLTQAQQQYGNAP